MTCGAAARTAMVAMIVKAVNVMRQSLSNTCSGDLEDDEDEDEDVQHLVGDLDEYEYEDMSIVAIMLVTTTTDSVRSTMAANFQSFSMAAVSSSSLSLSVITCFHRR